MNLLERIEAGMKESLKSGDKDRSETLKMLKSDMMYEKGKTGKDLTEEQMQESVMRGAKRRKESIREYEAAGRKDLADKEAVELKIIEEFLPAQMSFEDVEKAVDKILRGNKSPQGFLLKSAEIYSCKIVIHCFSSSYLFNRSVLFEKKFSRS